MSQENFVNDENDETTYWFEKNSNDEIELNPMQHDAVVNIGANQWVTIDKMYGPAAYLPLRVRPDYKSYGWIVEQMCILQEPSRDQDMEWRQVAWIPAFPDVECMICRHEFEHDEGCPEHDQQ